MCFMCDQWGDPEIDGGLWYYNPKNFSRNMYKLREPGQGFAGPRMAEEAGGKWRVPKSNGYGDSPTLLDLQDAAERGDSEAYKRMQSEMWTKQRTVGGGHCQIVPLRDADRILELCSPIGLMSCSCRRNARASDERAEVEKTCMGMGVGMLKWERWPENYKGGVNFLSIEEGKEWNHKMDKRGMIHLLMLFGAPYIGGFCQCDYPVCNEMRRARDYHVGVMRGHYISVIDWDLCNGCGICVQRCQMGAINFNPSDMKAFVREADCWGCGLCESGCPQDAITLVRRETVPALAEVWT
jgi:NAD-dependent dihydropyrimidine dehydrogenase PreA subunit